MSASWRLSSTHQLVLLLLLCCYLGCSWGETKRRDLLSHPSFIRRIDRACESYSPSTIHFFVVARNPIIVPPHSTLHSSASSTPYPRWLMVFPISHFPILFFLFFLIPLCFQWNKNLVHLFCSSLSIGYSFNQFKYAATDLTKTVR